MKKFCRLKNDNGTFWAMIIDKPKQSRWLVFAEEIFCALIIVLFGLFIFVH